MPGASATRLPRRAARLFWLVVPLELSLYVSTVYLRHHWIPDIAAGIVLGAVRLRGGAVAARALAAKEGSAARPREG